MARIRNLKTFWKVEWYARVYELARDGVAVSQIGAALGIGDHTWRRCWKELPAVRDAAKRGVERNKSRKEDDGMPAYIFRHLPAELKPVWRELERVFDVESDPEGFVEGILSGHGAGAKKALYLHALVCANFDGHSACRKVGVSAETVRNWCAQDPAYARLIKEEVLEIKRDLVEGGVFKAVQRGSTPELLWAAKCLLRARGYSTQRDDARDAIADALTAKVHLDALGVEDLRTLLGVVREEAAKELAPKTIQGEVVDSPPTTLPDCTR